MIIDSNTFGKTIFIYHLVVFGAHVNLQDMTSFLPEEVQKATACLSQAALHNTVQAALRSDLFHFCFRFWVRFQVCSIDGM